MGTVYKSAVYTLDHLPSPEQERQASIDSSPCARKQNVGDWERKGSLAAGGILALLGLARRDFPGLVLAGLGGGLLYRGATGHCYAYDALGIDTAQNDRTHADQHSKHHIQVTETFLIDKLPDELYRFWRDLENLPAIMTHLQSVKVIDDRRSHWIADAPAVAGGSVEWDAEISEDVPNKRIAWRSLPDSDIDTQGSVEFGAAPGKRGTIVRVGMEYCPPAGQLGALIARLFGKDPERLIREDLRNFKRIMEIGDILQVEGQPRGSCATAVASHLP